MPTEALAAWPGWTAHLPPEPAEDPLRLIERAERLEALGAPATDVEPEGSMAGTWAWLPEPKLVERVRSACPSALLSALPPATRPELPDLSALPVELGGLRIQRHGKGPGDLLIDPGAAFGHGLHPTTAMMLEQSARVAPPARILDIGTGSGILALHALLRAPKARAVAQDIAPAALAATRANAAHNHLGSRVTVTDILPERTHFDATGFDLVLANIRTHILEALAERITALCAPNATLLLSGIRFAEVARVQTAFATAWLEEAWMDRGWWCVKFRPHTNL